MRGAALALAFAVLPAVAHASAQELFGVAPRDIALAGAATALGDHDGAVYYDPAGLVEAPRVRFHVVGMQADSHLTIDGARAPGIEPLRASSIGLELPLPLRGPLADRFAVGFLLHSPNDRLLRVYSRPAEEPQLVLLQNHAQVLGLYAGGAVRIWRGIAIGGGARLLADVRARVQILADERGVDNVTSGFLTTTASPVASVRVAPPGAPWSAALVWRAKSAQTFSTPTRSSLGGFSAPTPGLRATTCFVPAELVAGAVWRAGAFSFTGDLGWKQWSQFPDPTVQIGRISPSTAPFPRFHDTIAPRTGVEWTRPFPRFSLVLRGGYAFEPTPVPAQDDDFSLYDSDRHILAAGVGAALPWHEGRMRFDVGAQGHRVSPRSWDKNPSKVPAGTILHHRTGGEMLALAASVSWEY